jgi:hypothetical protein
MSTLQVPTQNPSLERLISMQEWAHMELHRPKPRLPAWPRVGKRTAGARVAWQRKGSDHAAGAMDAMGGSHHAHTPRSYRYGCVISALSAGGEKGVRSTAVSSAHTMLPDSVKWQRILF